MQAVPRSRLGLFPISTQVMVDGDGETLAVAGHRLKALARQHGTPLYLFDQATLDDAVSQYRQALASHYPGAGEITYAGKAGLTLALAQWADARSLWLDCTGVGELHVATTARFPAARILVHGVNKSAADLAMAVRHAALIVVDNRSEFEKLRHMHAASSEGFPQLWLRVRPGLAVETHAFRQTGQQDSKFGLSWPEAATIVAAAQEAGMAVTGIHFHQGSHFHDVEPVIEGVRSVLRQLTTLHAQSGWAPQALCAGGGWGVAYHEDDLPQPSIDRYVAAIAQTVVDAWDAGDVPLPRLHVEPGRSLVARAGIALYRVGAVKQTPNRRWLLIDGGMADNIRPALYGARYSALPVDSPMRRATLRSWLGGPDCESGDVLIDDLLLPAVDEGEWLAIPASGAYHLSMSSNYNGACRPAVVWLNDRGAQLIRRRESPAELIQRDLRLDTIR